MRLDVMQRLLKEPLLHFLLLGAAIFAVFEAVSPANSDTAGEAAAEIVVSQARVDALTEKFVRTWQRPPSAQEVDGLIQDYVREEAAVREATALGIDRDDTVIRRLLRQRLEFITEDVATLAEPTDADLAAYLRDHAEDFRGEDRVSFSHVYFDPQRRGAALAADAAQLRARLNAQPVPAQADAERLADLGDASLLERQFTDLPLSMAARMFGEAFAAALREQPPGQWSAPVASEYGEHLVYVTALTPGRIPELAEIRDAVQREWATARRRAALDAFYADLLQRYRVTVERSETKAGADQLAEWRR